MSSYCRSVRLINRIYWPSIVTNKPIWTCSAPGLVWGQISDMGDFEEMWNMERRLNIRDWAGVQKNDRLISVIYELLFPRFIN